MKKYLNYAHFGLLVGICAFVYFMYTGLTREKLVSASDLTEIKGTYLRHSFKDNTGFKNFTHQYYIWVANYSNAFQVKADYLRFFNAEQFAANVKPGDSIVFTIPTKLKTKLNSEENVFVTSIWTNSGTHIDQSKTLDFEKHSADKKLPINHWNGGQEVTNNKSVYLDQELITVDKIPKDEHGKSSYYVDFSFRDFLGEIKNINQTQTDTLLNDLGVNKYWLVINELTIDRGDTTTIEKLIWTEKYGLTGYYKRNGDFYKIDLR